MKTAVLLRRIDEVLANRPEATRGLDWSEIEECVQAELSYEAAMYAAAQREMISERVRQITVEAERLYGIGDFYGLRILLAELTGIAQALPDADSRNEKEEQAAFDHAALRHYREDTLVVIGDSHVNFFSGNELLEFVPIGNGINLCPQVNGYPFTALYLFSGLAYTSHNKQSSGGFYSKLLYLLDRFIHPGARILVSLGEIDIRVHVFKQARLQNRSYRDIIGDVLTQYMLLLRELKEQGYTVYCWGPIASQSDSISEDPAYPRTGTEQERNEATAYFTERIYELCSSIGIPVLSIFFRMVTEDMRTRTEYLSADHFHLSQRAMELARPLLLEYKLLR